jgi:hypothetical protein
MTEEEEEQEEEEEEEDRLEMSNCPSIIKAPLIKCYLIKCYGIRYMPRSWHPTNILDPVT